MKFGALLVLLLLTFFRQVRLKPAATEYQLYAVIPNEFLRDVLFC